MPKKRTLKQLILTSMKHLRYINVNVMSLRKNKLLVFVLKRG